MGRSPEKRCGSPVADSLSPPRGARPPTARPGLWLHCRGAAVRRTIGVGFGPRVPAEMAPTLRKDTDMDVRIETLDPIHVARTRHVGPYAEVAPCLERLFRWAAAIGVPPGRVLTLSWDDPQTVPSDRLRSDACLELRTDEEPPPGIELGACAVGNRDSENSISSWLSPLI